ncbi:hypothetical protein EPUL_003795 [Erysiphe pulchra]|uniref:Uncharacterized protein n=1 Tax=Erysiphe pulchra TaxID=225359 RepID=A0A2S4PXD2_9PEZI|nr:hypothetical protein EPUL_003795 [Erysiphe pulchra]
MTFVRRSVEMYEIVVERLELEANASKDEMKASESLYYSAISICHQVASLDIHRKTNDIVHPHKMWTQLSTKYNRNKMFDLELHLPNSPGLVITYSHPQFVNKFEIEWHRLQKLTKDLSGFDSIIFASLQRINLHNLIPFFLKTSEICHQ